MRVSQLALLFLALIGAGAEAQAMQTGAPPSRPTGTAHIAGTIVASDTSTPVRGATVSLSSSGTNERTAYTDDLGRFEVAHLPAGAFSLSVAKVGFVTTFFGQTVTRQRGQPIDLASGASFDRADVRMPRGGVIAGRVFDEFGEPAGRSLSAA